MDIPRSPLAAALFFYECLRLSLLIVFLFISSSMGNAGLAGGAFFPYIVYISSNALFPLMALFMWLRPGEYRNYITLYMAGKIIGVVSFYVWTIFSSREAPGLENMARVIALFGGSIFVNFADILSVWGAWALKNKYQKAESGGIECGLSR